MKQARSTGLGGLALAAAVGISSALSFAVHAFSSRQLTVADYGALAAVLAIMTAAAVPVGAIQTALTRSAAELLADGHRPSGRLVLAQTLPLALAITGLGAAVAPVVARFLDLSSSTAIVCSGAWVGVVLVGSVGKALLIAEQRLTPVAHALVHGAVIRLVVGVVLTPRFGVTGGAEAAVVGDAVASLIFLGAAYHRGLLAPAATTADVRSAHVAWPDAGRALSTQLSLWIFASLAVIVGRRTLTGDDSGSFAAMSTAAVACLFLPQAVATIVFPRFVADGSRRLLLRATLLAAAVGVICALTISARPAWMFRVFFGPAYAPNRSVLLVLCLHFVLLGCLTVLSQYLVARRQAGALTIWAGVIVAAVVAAAFGRTPLRVASFLLVPNVLVTLHLGLRAVLGRVQEPGDVSMPATPPDGPAAAPARVDALRRSPVLDLSVVVPTYNDGERLRSCVDSLCDALDGAPWTYEVIVVDDGSTDGAVDSLASRTNLRVERLGRNRGKGAALRHGFAAANGGVIGFLDGDGDIAPAVLVELVDRLLDSAAWIGVASKNLPGATVAATRRRRVMSMAYRLAVHWMFDLEVTDTQCGCKVFRRRFLASTLAFAREEGFALDLELLTIGSRLGMKRAVEVPVQLVRVDHGRVTANGAVRVLVDTLRIRRRLPPATWAPLPLGTPLPVGVDLSSPLLP